MRARIVSGGLASWPVAGFFDLGGLLRLLKGLVIRKIEVFLVGGLIAATLSKSACKWC